MRYHIRETIMGAESQCTVHFAGQRSEGKALLETDHLIFRGKFRLDIPRKSITTLDADAGKLRVTFSEGTAVFELGPSAAKWAEKIRNPSSLLDKLGVKPGMRVAVSGIDDAVFLEQLADRTSDVARRTPKKDTEMIIFGAKAVSDLARLEKLRGYLTPAGAIWVVHPKGKTAPFRDVDVFAAAKRAGLVDVKVAAFSATHTAEKLVVPIKLRK
jgi:hypothetical protein